MPKVDPVAPRFTLSSSKIWDGAPHNAFTDLLRFKSRWYCSLRESDGHMSSGGRIRILSSKDGRTFGPAALFEERGVDLRDPKLSVTPRGRLMLLAGATRFEGGQPVGRRPRTAFSEDGAAWSPLEPILEEGDWLWRATWHGRWCYGVTYRLLSPRRWTITLLRSTDGVHYEGVAELEVGGKPNETSVRFLPDGTAVVLVRREGGNKRGWVGTSPPPYIQFRWSELRHRLGGPNLVVLPDGTMWAGTRIIRGSTARTCLGPITTDSFAPLVELPSGGDCGYPGLVSHRGRLWVSYYSSHEGKSAVYLALLSADLLARVREAAQRLPGGPHEAFPQPRGSASPGLPGRSIRA